MLNEIQTHFGQQFETALVNEINQVGTFKEIPKDFKLIEVGDYIKFMPLLLEGAIKILRDDPDGDELLLYFLEKGDTCAMTLSCCLGQRKSEIRAIAEMDSKLIMIPIEYMEDWSAKYKSWRHFVFESHHNRLNEMLQTIDSIAFLKMDERLLHYLKEKVRVTGKTKIQETHKEISYALHTSRVVISRLLKKLENMGEITLDRNQIHILK